MRVPVERTAGKDGVLILTLSERTALAQLLLRLRDQCAAAVTEEFLASDAGCFGNSEAGKDRCRQDLGYHVQFLAGAVQAGSPAMFRDYTAWCAGVLATRGIPESSVDLSVETILRWLRRSMPQSEAACLDAFLRVEIPPLLPTAESLPPEPVRLAREVYVAALLAGDRRAALTVVDESLHAGCSLVEIYVDVLAASLHEIGKLWETNSITVAQEHIATAITQTVVSSLYSRIPVSPRNRGRMVVSGVAGEMHQVGPNLLADAMEAEGWKVRFLGANVPSEAMLQEIARFEPDVLCISTTLVSNLPVTASIIRAAHQRFGEGRPRIFVGGSAFHSASDDFVRELGVIRSDLRGALRILCPSDAQDEVLTP